MGAELSNPATKAFLVTPSDSTDVVAAAGFLPRAVYVGGAGNLNVVMSDDTGTDTTVLFTGVTAGSVLPIRPKKVYSTSTTATAVVVLG